MAKHRTYTEDDLRYLRMLSRMFPTVRAAATEIIRFWMGKTKVTAVRALSETLETKMESTTLYNACTSMEAIIGRDILTIRRFMGRIPILFSLRSFIISS